MSRVIVLGASGRIGRLLRAAWGRTSGLPFQPIYQSRGAEIAPDILWRPGAPMEGLPTADAILALWGVTSGTGVDENAALAVEAARVARHTGAARVLHLSSAAVYGPGCDRALEDDPPRPASGYGASKLAMERAVAGLDDGCAHVCLRLGNVVGADSLTGALTGETAAVLDRFDSGAGPLRSYVAPAALAGIFARLLTLPADALPPVLNVASPEPIRMDALLTAAGRSFDWRAAPEGAVERATLSTDRLAALLGPDFRPATADEMIAEWRELRPA